MQLTAEHYFRVSRERLTQAIALYRIGDAYALAMYVAGVSVECMLRAYKLRIDPVFDEKHNLQRLFRASGILNLDPSRLRGQGLKEVQVRAYIEDIRSAVNEVVVLWANTYRFASENRLRAYLWKMAPARSRTKGDHLKFSALRLLNAAQRVVEKGGILWRHS